MGHSPQTALELIELATFLRRRSAGPQHYCDQMCSTAAEIEAHAQALIEKHRAAYPGSRDMYAPVQLTI